MRELPYTPELAVIASHTVWFKPPREALANPVHFVAYVLIYGTDQDVTILRRYLSDNDLCEALDQAPPGIFDARSGAYWNLKMGRSPAPPLPKTAFPE